MTDPAFTDRKSCQCPTCATWCEARPAFKQATRREPMQFLGWQAFCRTCTQAAGGFAVGFTPEHVQELMPV